MQACGSGEAFVTDVVTEQEEEEEVLPESRTSCPITSSSPRMDETVLPRTAPRLHALRVTPDKPSLQRLRSLPDRY